MNQVLNLTNRVDGAKFFPPKCAPGEQRGWKGSERGTVPTRKAGRADREPPGAGKTPRDLDAEGEYSEGE